MTSIIVQSLTCLHAPSNPPSPKSLIDLKAKISAGDPLSTVGQWLLTAPQRKLCIGCGGGGGGSGGCLCGRAIILKIKGHVALWGVLKKKVKIPYGSCPHNDKWTSAVPTHAQPTGMHSVQYLWVFIHANPYIKGSFFPPSKPPPPSVGQKFSPVSDVPAP